MALRNGEGWVERKTTATETEGLDVQGGNGLGKRGYQKGKGGREKKGRSETKLNGTHAHSDEVAYAVFPQVETAKCL